MKNVIFACLLAVMAVGCRGRDGGYKLAEGSFPEEPSSAPYVVEYPGYYEIFFQNSIASDPVIFGGDRLGTPGAVYVFSGGKVVGFPIVTSFSNGTIKIYGLAGKPVSSIQIVKG